MVYRYGNDFGRMHNGGHCPPYRFIFVIFWMAVLWDYPQRSVVFHISVVPHKCGILHLCWYVIAHRRERRDFQPKIIKIKGWSLPACLTGRRQLRNNLI